MLLRDRLNEFELDWAQAPVRSGLIPAGQIKGKKFLIVGREDSFEAAIGWSLAAWNDERRCGVRAVQAVPGFGAEARSSVETGFGAEATQGSIETEEPDTAESLPGGGKDLSGALKARDSAETEEPDTAEGLPGRGKDLPGALKTRSSAGPETNQHLTVVRTFTEETFSPEEADYVILTGLCCRGAVYPVEETVRLLREFRQLVRAVTALNCGRVLLLSDGRVYGRLGEGFAASEYEAGRTDPCAPGFEAQYLLQAMEGIFVSEVRAAAKQFNVLRTGLIYGPCISMMENPASALAARTAARQEIALSLSREKSSYICIHDVLTAVQFVLTVCPANKILNASGPDSDVTIGELAMLLYDNFPEQARICLTTSGIREASADGKTAADGGIREVSEDLGPGSASVDSGSVNISAASGTGDAVTDPGIFLNTQLIRRYGFRPAVSLEDGLIILVKSLQKTGEVFIFDNTYLGKLEKVQQILLAYLLEIDRICKKYNIRYFLAGGTLLGAIRHHGFIPWDDDADVMMLREDYDRFLEVAQNELPENIFLQLPHTEKGNYNPFTKLRIDNTLFATEFTGHFLWMHNGIFFDILAHDRTGRSRWSQKLHLMATMLMRSIVFNKWGDTDIAGGGGHPIICKIVDKVKYLVPMRFALWAQNRLLEFYKNRDTGYLYDGMGRNLSRGAFPAEWLAETVYVDFEGYRFPVPKEYDKYLTYLYGDYMQMIPVSRRRTSHSIVLMDLGEYSNFTLGREERFSDPR